MSGDTPPPSLVFEPRDALTFSVSNEHSAESSLRLVNESLSSVVFKVKTTTPDRYLVKPNHGQIDKGKDVRITILIAQVKKKEILAQRDESCGDKFLVQFASASPSAAADLGHAKSSAAFADAITRHMAQVDRKKVGAKKLVVEYVFPERHVHVGGASGKNTKYQQQQQQQQRGGDENTSSFSGAYHQNGDRRDERRQSATAVPGSPESMFAEIVALRKKYDDLVDFTVNLTAERDTLSNELSRLKRAAEADIETTQGAKRVNAGAAVLAGGDAKNHDGKNAPPQQTKRSLLTHLVLACAVAFVLGRLSQRWIVDK